MNSIELMLMMYMKIVVRFKYIFYLLEVDGRVTFFY